MRYWYIVVVLLLLSSNVIAEHHKSVLPPGREWKLVWHDEFYGNELDTSKWQYRLHIMHTRHNTFTNTGAVVKNGLLYLNLIEHEGQYYSPHLQTGENFMDRPPQDKFTSGLTWPIAELKPPLFMHKYGYYEVRCKLQTQPGWWSAFWLQSPCNGSTLNPAISGMEIDIMENFTRDNIISHNIHWDGCGKNLKSRGSGQRQLTPSEDGFHTFGVWWSKTNYVFYVDGKESWRMDGPVSHIEQFILLSTECMGYRQENRDQPSDKLKKAVLPDAFVVDYVRVYDEVE